MLINVAQLLKWPVGTTRIYPIETEGPLPLDDEMCAQLTGGRVRLDRIDGGILARADFDCAVEMECSRCLEVFPVSIRMHFEEEFAPSIDVASGAPLPPPEDDLMFVIDSNHVLDLSEAFRQNIIASLPI